MLSEKIMQLKEQHLKKGVNTVQIVVAVIVLYFIFPWLISFGESPYKGFIALSKGVEYTGVLETRPSDFGSDLTGIEVTYPNGKTDFIMSDLITDLSQEVFLGKEHTVFIDENGNQFWFIYESLVIIFFSLFVFFFFLRIVLSLLAVIISKLKVGQDNRIIERTNQITLLFKPLTLLFFGFFLYAFSQYRIFGFEDEKEFFFIALYIYAAFTVFVFIRRLMRLKNDVVVKKEQGSYASSRSTEEVDVITPINNDLIKRDKVKYKHQTSRFDR
ncbi:hypothetical protein NWE55_06585 [Myroides albus]|uniref:DUF1189 domain-containing protein n=2 Tax=Myroides TaxID=76831 RepID=A0A6I3LKJ0_9FLAO|nr:hypothetical protein [Myroides albus]MTG96682.1 hypothetical protein [Myroides albus]UVD80906.1 hypothetical protein NWE55_06585 [Myroides albus]